MENTGNRIQALRETRNLSQRQLSTYIGLSNATISRIESGDVAPDMKTLNKIAEYFGVSIDFLMGSDKTVVPIDYPTDLKPLYYKFAKKIQEMEIQETDLENVLKLMESMKKK